jgi:hypothetical protein
MKRKISGLGMAIAIVLMTLVVSGCGGKENPLSGTWQSESYSFDKLLFVDNAMIFLEKGFVEMMGIITFDKNNGVIKNWHSVDIGTLSLNNNILTLSLNGDTDTFTKDAVSKFQELSSTKKIKGVWRASEPKVELGLVIIGSTVFFSAVGEGIGENAIWTIDFENDSGVLSDDGDELGTLSLKGKNLVLTMEGDSFTFTKVAP